MAEKFFVAKYTFKTLGREDCDQLCDALKVTIPDLYHFSKKLSLSLRVVITTILVEVEIPIEKKQIKTTKVLLAYLDALELLRNP